MERFSPKPNAGSCGGKEKVNYKTPDTRPGCDQKGHSERSKANQSNHQKHRFPWQSK